MLGCKGWTCCSIGLLLALFGLFLCSNWSLWSWLFVFILWQSFGKMLFNWDDSKNYTLLSYTLFFSVGILSALLVKNTGMLLWLVMSIRRWSLIHNQEQGNVKLNSNAVLEFSQILHEQHLAIAVIKANFQFVLKQSCILVKQTCSLANACMQEDWQ